MSSSNRRGSGALKAVAAVLLASAVIAFVAARSEAVQDWALLRVFAAVTVDPNAAPTPDALSASVCGSRSPIPDSNRAEACVLVQAGERLFVVDAGDGSVARLRQWATPFNKIESVFLTHLHSDHISDLGDLHLATWVMQNRPGKLPVYGPRGVDRVTAFLVDHPPVVPAYGYRFEYRGRSLVISGDTNRSQAVVDNSRGVDVLFHEAQSNEMLDMMIGASIGTGQTQLAALLEDIQTYHSTAAEAAEVANAAGVGHLVYYHLTPPPRNWLMERRLLRNAVNVREDDWTLAQDGTQVTLPVGSDEIRIGTR